MCDPFHIIYLNGHTHDEPAMVIEVSQPQQIVSSVRERGLSVSAYILFFYFKPILNLAQPVKSIFILSQVSASVLC